MSSSVKPPYDPELLEVFNVFPKLPSFTKEILVKVRKSYEPLAGPEANLTDPAISHEEKIIPGPGGDIALAILRSRNSAGGKRPGIVYYHGGGMIMGTRFMGISTTFEWVKEFDAVAISVEYRLAPE
jgi:acetyl esterase/lipase